MTYFLSHSIRRFLISCSRFVEISPKRASTLDASTLANLDRRITEDGVLVQWRAQAQGAIFQPANRFAETESEQRHRVSWMINFPRIFQRVFDLSVYVFTLTTEELLQDKFLPLVIIPFFVSGQNHLLCHQKQGKVGNLPDQFVGQVINLLMQVMAN
jgi:hypothetical protein